VPESNNGGYAPDVRRATVFFIGTSACFIEALERSLASPAATTTKFLIRDRSGVCQSNLSALLEARCPAPALAYNSCKKSIIAVLTFDARYCWVQRQQCEAMIFRYCRVGSGEFHPEPLTDQDMSLSSQSRRPAGDESWQSSWGRGAAAGSGAPRGR